MKKRYVISIFVIITLSGFWLFQKLSDKRKYEDSCGPTNNPRYEAKLMDSEDTKFIEEVLDSWSIYIEMDPDEEIEKIIRDFGFNESVAGIVELFSYEFPPYSFTNSQENQRSTEIADSLPISPGQTIFYRNGLAYIKLSGDFVQLYEDTPLGLRSAMYRKSTKQTEQAASSDAIPFDGQKP